ncbi:hypothetical protein AVEN_18679-1 [Araneus ventricosus]|uniref:Uncharacterized protein n=1 Tax=Araneus ventricosus TaxID=182803 RepID=A0A4Y2IB69_ARAVE|nr:hypothetical protein AVEN_18679-1 [Araneus ventricosus]
MLRGKPDHLIDSCYFRKAMMTNTPFPVIFLQEQLSSSSCASKVPLSSFTRKGDGPNDNPASLSLFLIVTKTPRQKIKVNGRNGICGNEISEEHSSQTELISIIDCRIFLLLSNSSNNPSDLNQIRSMRPFAFITSNTKSGGLSRSSYIKATQSSRCCGVASIMLHFVQILNFLSPRENLRVFK